MKLKKAGLKEAGSSARMGRGGFNAAANAASDFLKSNAGSFKSTGLGKLTAGRRGANITKAFDKITGGVALDSNNNPLKTREGKSIFSGSNTLDKVHGAQDMWKELKKTKEVKDIRKGVGKAVDVESGSWVEADRVQPRHNASVSRNRGMAEASE